ncbi:MAG: hypothetical protein WCV85_01640 [Patescibacteria group bacterium]|jgi:hypothetical protein
MPTKKWEYKVFVDREPLLEGQKLEMNMNVLGKEGWEAFAAWETQNCVKRVLFRRPLQES